MHRDLRERHASLAKQGDDALARKPGDGEQVGSGGNDHGAARLPAPPPPQPAPAVRRLTRPPRDARQAARPRWCRPPGGHGRSPRGGRRCPAARPSGGSRQSTARPSPASLRRKPRIQTMPSGSRPLKGSSSMRIGRVAEHGRGQPEALAHAQGVAAGLAPRHALQAGLRDHLIDAARRSVPASGPARAGGCDRCGSGAGRWRQAARRPARRGWRRLR